MAPSRTMLRITKNMRSLIFTNPPALFSLSPCCLFFGFFGGEILLLTSSRSPYNDFLACSASDSCVAHSVVKRGPGGSAFYVSNTA